MIDCRAVDSSVGGLGLFSPELIDVGQFVQIALQLPDRISGTHRVVVQEGYIAAAVLTREGYRVGVRLSSPLQDLLDAVDGGRLQAELSTGLRSAAP